MCTPTAGRLEDPPLQVRWKFQVHPVGVDALIDPRRASGLVPTGGHEGRPYTHAPGFFVGAGVYPRPCHCFNRRNHNVSHQSHGRLSPPQPGRAQSADPRPLRHSRAFSPGGRPGGLCPKLAGTGRRLPGDRRSQKCHLSPGRRRWRRGGLYGAHRHGLSRPCAHALPGGGRQILLPRRLRRHGQPGGAFALRKVFSPKSSANPAQAGLCGQFLRGGLGKFEGLPRRGRPVR